MRARSERLLREGLIGGLLGYLAVVLGLSLLNLLAGRPVLHTAQGMGALLLGATDAAAGETAGAVLLYNGAHLVGSLAIGMLAATLMSVTERHLAFWYAALTVLIAAVVYAITVVGAFGVEIGGVTDWTTVVVGTVLWIGTMTAYFWRVHRGLVHRIERELDGPEA